MRLLVLLLLVLGMASCVPNQPHPKSVYLEIYTTSTIYYVDYENLTITSENDDTNYKFESAQELTIKLERLTAQDASNTYDEMDQLDAEIELLRTALKQCK